MPAFHKIDRERRLVITTVSDMFTLKDALVHQQELSNDPDFDPSYSQLVDATQVTKIEMGGEDIRKLAERTLFSPQSRRAFLVSNDLAYGLGRMFEILRESMGVRGIRVFRNLDNALEWALAKGATP